MRRVITIILNGKEVWCSHFDEELHQDTVQAAVQTALKEYVLDVGGGEFEVIEKIETVGIS